MTDKQSTQPPVYAPLCGASKAYGRFDRWWWHESECPVRIAQVALMNKASNQEQKPDDA